MGEGYAYHMLVLSRYTCIDSCRKIFVQVPLPMWKILMSESTIVIHTYSQYASKSKIDICVRIYIYTYRYTSLTYIHTADTKILLRLIGL